MQMQWIRDVQMDISETCACSCSGQKWLPGGTRGREKAHHAGFADEHRVVLGAARQDLQRGARPATGRHIMCALYCHIPRALYTSHVLQSGVCPLQSALYMCPLQHIRFVPFNVISCAIFPVGANPRCAPSCASLRPHPAASAHHRAALGPAAGRGRCAREEEGKEIKTGETGKNCCALPGWSGGSRRRVPPLGRACLCGPA